MIQKIAGLGGSWSSGGAAGGFYWNSNNSVSSRKRRKFVYSDIKKISERDFLGYEFILQEYSKDEFIQAQAKKSSLLEKQMKDMQSAFIENVD